MYNITSASVNVVFDGDTPISCGGVDFYDSPYGGRVAGTRWCNVIYENGTVDLVAYG